MVNKVEIPRFLGNSGLAWPRMTSSDLYYLIESISVVLPLRAEKNHYFMIMITVINQHRQNLKTFEQVLDFFKKSGVLYITPRVTRIESAKFAHSLWIVEISRTSNRSILKFIQKFKKSCTSVSKFVSGSLSNLSRN